MNNEQLNKLLYRAYDKGYYDALGAFAHWKDGQQEVGTIGTTLKTARKTMHDHYSFGFWPQDLEGYPEQLIKTEVRDMKPHDDQLFGDDVNELEPWRSEENDDAEQSTGE